MKKISYEIYKKWLPNYCNEDFDNERDIIINEIKKELNLLLQSETNITRCMNLLEIFSTYKYEYKKEEEIYIIESLYKLIFDKPNIDFVEQTNLCSELARILSRRNKLKNLIIQWRPMYILLKKLYFPKVRSLICVPKHNHATTLVKLIRKARNYFSDDAEYEILEEIRPYLCPHDQSIFYGQGMLTLFLPTISLRIDTSLNYFGNYQTGNYSWLEEIISISSWMENAPPWDTLCVRFFARVAKGGKSINWNPFMPVLFSKILRLVANSGQPLPVGTTNFPIPGNINLPIEYQIFLTQSSSETANMIHVAKFIVAVISSKSSCQKYLSQLMSYIEPYYHPSNYGAWSSRLGHILKLLCVSFNARCAKEKKHRKKFEKLKNENSDLKEPEHFINFLTDNDIDQFVLCMLPIAMKALYSKQPLVTSGIIALRNLSFLRPKLVFPSLLENIISDLESSEHTHRIQSSLEVLGGIIKPLLWRDNYLDGGKYLSNLLLLSLPGIDVNDLMKTLATIRFYTAVLINVPLIDCSNISINNESDDDINLRKVTGYFADWAIQFLERSLALYSFTITYSKSSAFSLESAIHGPLYVALSLLFQQANPNLFDSLLSYVFNFTITNHIPSAIKEIGDICEIICIANPKKTLQQFIPYFHSILFPTSEECNFNHLSKSELEWILTIILSLVKCAGVDILTHKEFLDHIINISLSSPQSRKLYKLSCKIIRSILKCLTKVYILENRSVTSDIWNSDDFQTFPFKYWGAITSHDNLDVKWHYPSEEELNWAKELIKLYGESSLDNLEFHINEINNTNATMNDNNNNTVNTIPTSSRKDIFNSFYMLRMVFHGCAPKLTSNIEKENNEIINPSFTYAKEYIPDYVSDITFNNNELKFTDLKFNLTSISSIIIRLCNIFEESDDTLILTQLIKTIHKILNGKYTSNPKQNRTVLYVTNYLIGNTHLSSKKSVRYFTIQRISLNYSFRLYAKNYSTKFTNLICNLFFCLINLSVNHYSNIRSKAQSVVALTVVRYSMNGNFIGPKILSYLHAKAPSNHITGAIYLLHSAHVLTEIIRNWKLFQILVNTMCECHHHESPTVQKRMISLFEAISELFYTVPLDIKPIKGITTSNNIINNMKLQTKENYELYNNITDELSKTKLPWKYTIGIGNFLILLLRKDILPSISVVSFFHTVFYSDIIHLRLIGSGGLSKIFTIYKPQRKIIKLTNNNNNNNNNKDYNKIVRISVDEYKVKANEKLETEQEWENANFKDKNYYGWNGIPKQIKEYAPMTNEEHEEQISRIYKHPALKHMLEYFLSKEWWDLAITRLSTEVAGEIFQKTTAQCYKGLFQVYYDTFLDVLLPHISILSRNYQENGCQLLAAHIIAGLVRGSKHWPFSKLQKLWDYLIPIFNDVLEFATSHNISNWMMCINFCVYDRDPRRLHWLRESFFNSPNIKENLSAILQSKRIQTLSGILSEFSWKGSYYGDLLIDSLKSNISIDRKLIRGSLSQLSSTILSSNYDGLRNLDTNIPSLSGKQELNIKLKEFIQCMINELDRTNPLHINNLNLSIEEQEKLKKERTYCCTFILNWIIGCFNLLVAHTLLLYLPPLLPKLLAMRSDDTSIMVSLYTAIGYIANAEMSGELSSKMLNACYELLESSSWHTRATILPFMQVLVFKNIFVLKSQVPMIVQALVDALTDPQLEVRDLASKSLAGVLKFIDDDSVLPKLQEKFLEMASITLPERKYRKTDPSFASNLLIKHGGVLGLAALIQVHPYEIYPWLPELLVSFAVHINDPMPITNTVKKTFLEFWRVHQDAWAIEKDNFTQSQLTSLTELLVSPSYFA